MKAGRPNRSAGFAYIGAMIMVVVSGISISSAGEYWSTVMKRDREKELLFRGDCIRRGIESYYKASNNRSLPAYPRQMKDMLKDSRYPAVKRHLRRTYKDPMTHDGQWGLIYDATGGMKGVFSKSKARPLKTGNFPAPYKDFEKAATYADWKFIYDPRPSKMNMK